MTANTPDSKGENSEDTRSIDSEWIERFVSYAEGISTEGLQMLWARLLAKKATSIEGVSLRTLDVFRNLTQEDADAFERFLRIREALGGEFYPMESDDLLKCGLHPSELMTLADAKLIMAPAVPWEMVNNQLQQCWPTLHVILKSKSPHLCRIGGHVVAIYDDDNITMFAHQLTNEGSQIASIIHKQIADNELVEKRFNGVINVIIRRMGCVVKIDSDIESLELTSFEQYENNWREFEKQTREEYEQWKTRAD